MKRLILALLPVAAVVAVPLLLRRDEVSVDSGADQLVIVSPHNEMIRFEFERAFRDHYRARYGRDVAVDWRTPGGTSEIARYVTSEFTARFRSRWEEAGNAWSADAERAVLDGRLKQDEATPEQWRARQEFLRSTVGIGIDLIYGGGQYDLGRMASQGVLVPCGIREAHPELFEGPAPLIEQHASGETWYDDGDRYYGACLTAFGICYNIDRVRELGINPEREPPNRWRDLGDPRFFGRVGAADPSKSGSINKCFEMLIQQSMHETVREVGSDGPQALNQGWRRGMLLVKRLGGNARYFTLSAGRVPVDVGDGELAIGMCIDFYGRSQAEWTQDALGRPVMRYVTPVGGSSISADPIGMFRGAPHPDRAREFIAFVLSPEGQRLWNYRVGTPGGPNRFALRRLPIRADLYAETDRERMSDPQARPHELTQEFTYRPGWTARYFSLIRVLIRVMVIDCHDELRDAWGAIIDAGGPDAVPEAMAILERLPFEHADAADAARGLHDPEARLETTREWLKFFRKIYREAAQAARDRQAR